jgi:hypothetical protein
MEIRIIQRDHYGTGCSAHGYPTSNWMLSSQMACRHRCPPPEKSGVTLVEKLRTVVLFQGDFNYLNKYIGRHMTKDGEEHEQLTWEQYGSREGNNAIDQALNKVLSFDLIRQARVDAYTCYNDDKS